jgi:tRNA pseudouridine65 synthase
MWENYNLEILFQDESIVVINKPSGLLVHKSLIDSKEIYYAMKILRDQLKQWVYPIHRLDKPTSGVLLFALDSETARIMSEEFKNHFIEKKYLAIVRGYTDEGFIDYPLSVKHDKIVDKKADKEKVAQEAKTHYKTLSKIELPHAVGKYNTARYSLVELTPKTGRKHQLRRHMKHISHHILGDTKYGRGEHNKMVREHYDCHRLMLHAYSLEFTHPYSQERIIVRSPYDSVWAQFLQLFSFSLEQ